MSIQAMAWVLDNSRSEGVARLVLIALANHYNVNTGQCDPGLRCIAREANCSTGGVQDAVRRLVDLGELIVAQPGKGKATTKYHLPWSSEVAPSARSGPRTSDSEGSPSARSGPRTSDPVVRGRDPVVRGFDPVVRGQTARNQLTVNRTAENGATASGAVSAPEGPDRDRIARALAVVASDEDDGLHRATDEERARMADVIAQTRRKLTGGQS